MNAIQYGHLGGSHSDNVGLMTRQEDKTNTFFDPVTVVQTKYHVVQKQGENLASVLTVEDVKREDTCIFFVVYCSVPSDRLTWSL